MTKPKTTISGDFPCTLCTLKFDNPQKLGAHKRNVHPGNPLKPKRERSAGVPIQLSIGGPSDCPECGKTCANKAALAHHRQAAHGVLSKTRQRDLRRQEILSRKVVAPQPVVEETQIVHEKPIQQANSNTIEAIDPFLFALTVGQVKELCRHIAEEHGVPTKLFTRQFSQLFLAEARR